MTFDEMIEADLANCSEFGGVCNHTINGTTVPLEYLCFDENTEVVFEKDEYSGAETTVPALTVQTTKAGQISHKSILEIDGEIFGVIEIDMKKDNTTIVYLDRQ